MALDQGLTRTFTAPWALRAVPIFRCCRCDRLFFSKRLSRITDTVTHISNLTKIDKGVLLLFTASGPLAVRGSVPENGPGPWRLGVWGLGDWESGAFAVRSRAC